MKGFGYLSIQEDSYMGFFENNQKNGIGIQVYTNNLIYYGLWRNDQKHGYGELKYFQNVQKGTWHEDTFSGYGQHIYPS